MVRGVNKAVIEINDTENEFIERAILFVNPKFADRQKRQIDEYAKRLSRFVKLNITEVPDEKIPDNASEKEIELIKESLAIGTGKDRKKPDIDTFDWWNPFDYFSVDDIYKAAIYIPITNNQLAAVTGANQHIDYDEAMQLEDKYQRFVHMCDFLSSRKFLDIKFENNDIED